jgi:hypothetical protein
LIATRSLIESESHWCQHEERDGDRRCAAAALADAAGELNDAHPALLALCKALPKSFRGNAGHSVTSIAAFNDTHAHSQVVALFDRAIERQRSIGAMRAVSTSMTSLRPFWNPLLPAVAHARSAAHKLQSVSCYVSASADTFHTGI